MSEDQVPTRSTQQQIADLLTEQWLIRKQLDGYETDIARAFGVSMTQVHEAAVGPERAALEGELARVEGFLSVLQEEGSLA